MTLGQVNGECPVDGCPHNASLKYGGACEKHYYAKRYTTSDGVTTGRTPKLTDEQVRAIRKRSSQFVSPRDIALEFGVSIPTIAAVLKRTGAYAKAVES